MTNHIEQLLKIIGAFHWKSLFFVYLKRTLIVIIVPFFLLISFVLYYNITLDRQSLSYNCTNLFDNSFLSLENIISGSDKQFLTLSTDRYVKSIVETDDLSNSGIINNAFPKVIDSINTLILSFDYIKKIYIYSKVSNKVFTVNGISDFESLPDKKWYEIYKRNRDGYYCHNNTFYCLYTLFFNSDDCGVVIFEIDIEEVEKYINTQYHILDYYLRNQNGIILSTNNSKPYKTNLLFKEFNLINPLSLEALPYSDNVNENGKILLYVIAALVALIIFPIIFSVYLSVSYYNSIAEILNVFDNSMPGTENENEISFIKHSITNTLDKQKTIEFEISKKLTELKQTQSAVLQNQLNHHFLFNTLNLAILESSFEDDSLTAQILYTLSQLLGISLDNKNTLITVEEEVLYSKKYLDILLMRYDNSFDVNIEVDEDIKEYKILKLILQPLVENAFEHGIRKLGDSARGFINIKAKHKDEKIVFTIENNGSSLSEEQLKSINASLGYATIEKSSHIGMANVNQRIKLLYGKEYGCSIGFCNSVATVVIVLPYTPK